LAAVGTATAPAKAAAATAALEKNSRRPEDSALRALEVWMLAWGAKAAAVL